MPKSFTCPECQKSFEKERGLTTHQSIVGHKPRTPIDAKNTASIDEWQKKFDLAQENSQLRDQIKILESELLKLYRRISN